MSPSTPSRPDPRPAADACLAVVELLPWLGNGTLERDERRACEAHLAGCAACRAELAATATAWELLTWHVPSLALARYAAGLAPSESAAEPSRDEIEAHLAGCAACREELELATSAEVVEWPRRLVPAGPARRRAIALAASLALFLLSLAGAGRLRQTSAPAVAPDAPPAAAALPAIAAGVLRVDGFESGDLSGWQTSGPVGTASPTPRPHA